MSSSVAELRLPTLNPCELSQLPSDAVYIAAIGFEDRSLAWLDEAVRIGKRPQRVLAIHYLPKNSKNRTKAFGDHFKAMGLDGKSVAKLKYHRFEPDTFAGEVAQYHRLLSSCSTVVVDISGMSKFLIVTLLTELGRMRCRVELIYSEARIYHPTREEFESADIPAQAGAFLTRNVYTIATTERLTGMSMQNAPILLIAFATFNYRELDALCNELTPQTLLIVEGIPHLEEDFWRLEAVRIINKRLDSVENIKEHRLSTFDYQSTIEYLEAMYLRYADQYRIVIAPTGSKLQAVAVAFLKAMHPDVQIVYPVTSGFSKDYTDGCKSVWSMAIPDWQPLMNRLRGHRMSPVRELGVQLNRFAGQTN